MPEGLNQTLLKVVIVDDEDLARMLLREYCTQLGGIEILAECSNGFEAVKAVAEHKPDAVFLDVQMPKLDGFEVLELIGAETPIVFVTAFDQYAMKAFEAHAVDYLLKPYSLERFQKSIEKLRALPKSAPTGLASLAAEVRPADHRPERIVVRDGAKVHIIPLHKLDYVEAQDDYVALRSDKRNFLKQQTLSSLEEQLDARRFVRVHRSYIVNIERIARIEPFTKDSRVLVLQDGSQIPVSRTGHGKLKEILGQDV